MEKNPVIKAIKIAGGQAALARTLNVAPSLVYQWATGRRPLAAHHCISVEAASGVSRHELRPDVFGPAPKSEAA